METQTIAPPVGRVEVQVTQPAGDRRLWMAMRQGLLLIVTAIEEYLAIPPGKSALVARRMN